MKSIFVLYRHLAILKYKLPKPLSILWFGIRYLKRHFRTALHTHPYFKLFFFFFFCFLTMLHSFAVTSISPIQSIIQGAGVGGSILMKMSLKCVIMMVY